MNFIKEVVLVKVIINYGKIGYDGKEIFLAELFRVNGYGFLVIFFFVFGVDEFFFMIWGEIESIFFRLEGGEILLVGFGLGFKVNI